MAIEKWHWSPSQIQEFVCSNDDMKAVYYASFQVMAEAKHREAKRLNRLPKKGR